MKPQNNHRSRHRYCRFRARAASSRAPTLRTRPSRALRARVPKRPQRRRALAVVQVDLAQASGPSDVVCSESREARHPDRRRREVRAERGAAGVNAQTREEIQREISGQGWSSGWKTADQIAAERRTMLGR